MDNTMLIAMVIILGVCGLTAGIVYLRESNKLKQEDIKLVSEIFGISIALVDELNLKNEEKIIQISKVVQMSLDYSLNIFTNEKDVIEEAIKYTIDTCNDLGIELTENRKMLIEQLVRLGFQKRN